MEIANHRASVISDERPFAIGPGQLGVRFKAPREIDVPNRLVFIGDELYFLYSE